VRKSDDEDEDRSIAIAVETAWTYTVEGATKCQLAEALEVPLAGAGWKQYTSQTAGPSGVGAVRYNEFSRSPAFVTVVINAPPVSFDVRVQAHGSSPNFGSELGSSHLVPCQPDQPLPPPAQPADRAGALAAATTSHPVPSKRPSPRTVTSISS
jgi:hypothetical protein